MSGRMNSQGEEFRGGNDCYKSIFALILKRPEAVRSGAPSKDDCAVCDFANNFTILRDALRAPQDEVMWRLC